MSDPVKHPDHYTWLPGVECIRVTRWFNFPLGSAIKYIWRCGGPIAKGDSVELRAQDLKKAQQFIQFEIDRLLERPL